MIYNVLGAFVVLICLVTYLFKKKEGVLICFILENVFVGAQFILKNNYANLMIVIVASIRVVVYYIYSKKQLKPNIYALIVLEVMAVAVTIIFWNDYTSLFILASVMLSTYSTWQNNMTLLRICGFFAAILSSISYLALGLYVTVISKAILIISVSVGLTLYDVIPRIKNKKEKTTCN